MKDHHPKAASLGGKPANRLTSIGGQRRGHFRPPDAGQLLPAFQEVGPDQGNSFEPVWRGWNGKGGQGFDPGCDVVSLVDDGRDCQPERYDQEKQKDNRHYCHGQPAFAPEPCLNGQQHRPGGDGDHGGPHERGEKGADDIETGGDQHADEEYRQGRARNIWRGGVASICHFRLVSCPPEKQSLRIQPGPCAQSHALDP